MAAVLKPENASLTAGVLDRAGICVSALCMVQCLALPVLIVLTPFVSLGFFGTDVFHALLLAVIAPVSLAAFALGYRRHRTRAMLVPGLIGLAILGLALVMELAFHPNPWLVAAVTSSGGLMLIAGHWMNIRLRRRACVCPST